MSLNFYDGVVYSMPEHTLRNEPEAAAALARLAPHPPALIYVAMPSNHEEWQRLKHSDGRFLPHEDAYFFRPFAEHWPQMQEFALDVEHIADPLVARDLPGFVARHGRVQDFRFFRYQGGYGNCVIAFSAAGEPVDTLGCVA